MISRWNATPDLAHVDIVNVASVPQRSPFRYPGGKTWLVPSIRKWLASAAPVDRLVEPFAGGAIVSLTAVFENLADRALMVERDANVAAVWQVILNGGGEWLADEIARFPITVENVRSVLEAQNENVRERAFATILRNRVQRGGILAPGAGLLKEGEDGRGLRSRWYPETLRRRIRAITHVSDRIKFVEGDGLSVMRQYADRKRTAFFIDPPYTVAGRRLYLHCELDHEELFRVASRIAGHVLITYDYCEEICALASRFGFQTLLVPMKSTHHACKHELLIGKDLAWLRDLGTSAASPEFVLRTRAGPPANRRLDLRQSALAL